MRWAFDRRRICPCLGCVHTVLFPWTLQACSRACLQPSASSPPACTWPTCLDCRLLHDTCMALLPAPTHTPPPDLSCPAGTGLGVIHTAARTLTPLSTGYTLFGRVNMVEGSDGRLSMLTTAASSTKASAVVLLQVMPLGPPQQLLQLVYLVQRVLMYGLSCHILGSVHLQTCWIWTHVLLCSPVDRFVRVHPYPTEAHTNPSAGLQRSACAQLATGAPGRHM
jgi:hypothetical protein